MTPSLIHISDVFTANLIVFLVLFIVLIFCFRRNPEKTSFLSLDDTNELKWLAMLSIVAIHIGYSLVDNNAFLSPLSVFAWVGVDMFLFLSGYGLTMSMMKKNLSIRDFYRQRLIRLALPFWIILGTLLTLDILILWQTYSWKTMIESFLLYFPTARIWEDINSPFWYMTWLVFFYLLFPLVFIAKRVWLSAIILFISAVVWTQYNPLDMESGWLHALHTAAFPLGVLLASLSVKEGGIMAKLVDIRTKWNTRYATYIIYPVIFAIIYGLYQIQSWKVVESFPLLQSLDDGVHLVEQIKSILLGICFVALFFWKPWKNTFLSIFGLYSFEIYLIHWPLISRYDFLFHALPVWLATLLSFVYLLGLSMLIQKFFRKIF